MRLGSLLAAYAAATVTAVAGLGACAEPDEPAPSDAWGEGPELPSPRLEPAVAAAGARLVVAGGISTSAVAGLEITREVLALDTLAGTWTSLPELPVAWTHAALAASAGTLYLLGGLEGTAFVPRGESFALDPGADAWRDLPPLPPGQ